MELIVLSCSCLSILLVLHHVEIVKKSYDWVNGFFRVFCIQFLGSILPDTTFDPIHAQWAPKIHTKMDLLRKQILFMLELKMFKNSKVLFQNTKINCVGFLRVAF